MTEQSTSASRVQVTASPAPIPVEVICAWLRKEARRALLVEGGMVELSPLTAQRIAAELERTTSAR